MLEIKVAMTMLLGGLDIMSVATVHGGEPAEKQGFLMESERLRMRLALKS
jgi:hypothetical protein